MFGKDCFENAERRFAIDVEFRSEVVALGRLVPEHGREPSEERRFWNANDEMGTLLFSQRERIHQLSIAKMGRPSSYTQGLYNGDHIIFQQDGQTFGSRSNFRVQGLRRHVAHTTKKLRFARLTFLSDLASQCVLGFGFLFLLLVFQIFAIERNTTDRLAKPYLGRSVAAGGVGAMRRTLCTIGSPLCREFRSSDKGACRLCARARLASIS
jgi:hypothetical protein